MENSKFNFHPKCGQLQIIHLAFTDDLLLFSGGDIILVRILMECLANFGKISGLNMNAAKSSLYTAGIFGPKLDEILDVMNIPNSAKPFRYVGIPLAEGRLKVNYFSFFLEKIAAYISVWTASSLSYAGRTATEPR